MNRWKWSSKDNLMIVLEELFAAVRRNGLDYNTDKLCFSLNYKTPCEFERMSIERVPDFLVALWGAVQKASYSGETRPEILLRKAAKWMGLIR